MDEEEDCDMFLEAEEKDDEGLSNSLPNDMLEVMAAVEQSKTASAVATTQPESQKKSKPDFKAFISCFSSVGSW